MILRLKHGGPCGAVFGRCSLVRGTSTLLDANGVRTAIPGAIRPVGPGPAQAPYSGRIFGADAAVSKIDFWNCSESRPLKHSLSPMGIGCVLACGDCPHEKISVVAEVLQLRLHSGIRLHPTTFSRGEFVSCFGIFSMTIQFRVCPNDTENQLL